MGAIIEPIHLDPSVKFATVLDPGKTNFFQAFLATTPGHPIIKRSLQTTLEYYQGLRKLHGPMGTSTLKDAYDDVMFQKNYSNDPAESNGSKGENLKKGREETTQDREETRLVASRLRKLRTLNVKDEN